MKNLTMTDLHLLWKGLHSNSSPPSAENAAPPRKVPLPTDTDGNISLRTTRTGDSTRLLKFRQLLASEAAVGGRRLPDFLLGASLPPLLSLLTLASLQRSAYLLRSPLMGFLRLVLSSHEACGSSLFP
ncbi:unnamed protein product [Spirodela intermedia]|uniref:Uncharacterized protein n=1 Tax=Spirodela intermedia TaxID=51605 RepID=A0A7I8JMA6_SPIIN|nr:unnamed protein product [Spirodela intermedia]CAA6671298.1 unnamed protein product [Spirodela intermedia]